jgi:hypothetical protein
MVPSKELARLALQKRMLLAESEAQRLVLASELHRLITPLRWVDRLQTQVRPLWMVGAPVAGFWLTRRSKGMTRWLSAGFGALRLVKTLRRVLPRSPAK